LASRESTFLPPSQILSSSIVAMDRARGSPARHFAAVGLSEWSTSQGTWRNGAKQGSQRNTEANSRQPQDHSPLDSRVERDGTCTRSQSRSSLKTISRPRSQGPSAGAVSATSSYGAVIAARQLVTTERAALLTVLSSSSTRPSAVTSNGERATGMTGI
jgi:hypothetical protein